MKNFSALPTILHVHLGNTGHFGPSHQPIQRKNALRTRVTGDAVAIFFRCIFRCLQMWIHYIPFGRDHAAPSTSLREVFLLASISIASTWTILVPTASAQAGSLQRVEASRDPREKRGPLTPDELNLPTSATTGVPNGMPLTPSKGMTVTSSGAIIEGLDIRGQVYIQAEHVILKNCKVTYDGYAPIRIEQGLKGVVVQDCTVDGLGMSSHGITGAGTFLRNDISGVENGINVEANIPTVIKGNYIHDLKALEDPHYDGIQVFGDNKNVVIEGNTIINDQPGVSAVFVANTFGSVDNIRVTGNYLAGGGFPLYFSGTYSDAPMTNVVWEDNYVIKGGWGYEYIRADSKGNAPRRNRNILNERNMQQN